MSVVSEHLPGQVIQVRKCTPESRHRALLRHRHHELSQTLPTETLTERLVGTGRMIVSLAREGAGLIRDWAHDTFPSSPLAEVYDLAAARERRVGAMVMQLPDDQENYPTVTED